MSDLDHIVNRFEKIGVSTTASNHLKARKGRRPIRVDTLLKKKEGSQSGADLRIPLMGGTKFPTQDSGIEEAQKKLTKSQNIGVPPDPKTVGIKDLIPSYSVDSMPQVKAGSVMDISKDPLIQYLKKEAEDNAPGITTGDWPKGDRPIEKGELIDSGYKAAPKGDSEEAEVDEDPNMPKDLCRSSLKETKSFLTEYFGNTSGARKKGMDKDYPHKAGTVDSVAKR